MTLALTLIAIIAFTFLCAMSFLMVAHLPLSTHRSAGRHGRFANQALEHAGRAPASSAL